MVGAFFFNIFGSRQFQLHTLHIPGFGSIQNANQTDATIHLHNLVYEYMI